jgi:SAM-dependent methyltransferase
MSSLQDLILSLVDAGSREHYEDAALYDYEYRRRRADVAFYRELARRTVGGTGGGTVSGSAGRAAGGAVGRAIGGAVGSAGSAILDLGAGTGRLAVPLARDGHRVVAMDQAPAMLDRLRERLAGAPAVAARVEPRLGDLRTFELGRRFGLAIAAFNVVEHLYTRVELAAFLARVAAHLEPTGTLAFDVQMPDLSWLTRDPERRWARTRFTHPTTGRQLVYTTNHDYDPVTQIALIRIYYEPVEGGPTRVVKLSQRKFFPAELEALLAASGFRMVERYGDFDGEPLEGSAMSQVLVCQLASAFARPRPQPRAAERKPTPREKKIASDEKKSRPRRGAKKPSTKRPRARPARR